MEKGDLAELAEEGGPGQKDEYDGEELEQEGQDYETRPHLALRGPGSATVE